MSVSRVSGGRSPQEGSVEDAAERVRTDTPKPQARVESNTVTHGPDRSPVPGTPSERARLLRELAATGGEDARRAMNRAFEATDRVTLEATLRLLAQSGSLGAVVEGYGLDALIDLGERRALNVNDLLATTDSVRTRGLTTSEARTIQRNFGGTLDPSTVRLHFTVGSTTMGATALVLGNTIHVDPTHPQWEFRPGTTLPEDPENDAYQEVLLAHEPAHVWSYQHQGSQYAVRSARDQLKAMNDGASRRGAYTYDLSNPNFFALGEEQRATLVQDYVAAQRAVARGEVNVYANGLLAFVNAQQHLEQLEPYMRQLREAGPGQPNPPATPEPIPCACPHPPFRQDGVLGDAGGRVDAVIGQLGREAVSALTSDSPTAQAAGALGVAAAVAASLAPRDEQREGGGTAILDQAGIPRGVEVNGDGVRAAARLGYDAGFERPRAELEVAVQRGSIDARAAAEMGLDGRVQRAEGRFALDAPTVDVEVSGGMRRERDSVYGHARVAATGATISASALGRVHLDDSGVRSASASARVEGPRASVEGDVRLGRDGAFERARVGAAYTGPEASVAGEAEWTRKGLDALRVSTGAATSAGRVSAVLSAEQLTTSPQIEAGAALASEHATVTVSGTRDVERGESRVQVGVKVPLK